MSQRRALITGIAGQDGSYLAELLLEKGYAVHGIVRASTTRSTHPNIRGIASRIELMHGDITDRAFIERCLRSCKPHEVYNLASQSHVGLSFEAPEVTLASTGAAVLGILEAIRSSGFNSRFYQASTSELFGNVSGHPQNESTPFEPVSPYGCAKLFAHHITRMYRESYNMFACCGILFNHESPRRGHNFVTQKIARGVAAIKQGRQKELRLGNLEAKRDWGHARDYVRGMHAMLQNWSPDDFVLASGTTHTVREFLDEAFSHVDLDYQRFVVVDPAFYRPVDVNLLVGDPTRARKELGWEPTIDFRQLVHEMVDAAMAEFA